MASEAHVKRLLVPAGKRHHAGMPNVAAASNTEAVPALFRRAAGYVHMILKGAKPQDIPIYQGVKLDLVVNIQTAKAIRLDLPESIFTQANDIVE